MDLVCCAACARIVDSYCERRGHASRRARRGDGDRSDASVDACDRTMRKTSPLEEAPPRSLEGGDVRGRHWRAIVVAYGIGKELTSKE